MKLPRTIKVGPYEYMVRLVSGDEIPDRLGDANQDLHEIQIVKHLRTEKKREIILHEVLHTIHGLTGRWDDAPRTDEEWIDATVHGLLGVLRDNPKLVEYLVGEGTQGSSAPTRRPRPSRGRGVDDNPVPEVREPDAGESDLLRQVGGAEQGALSERGG